MPKLRINPIVLIIINILAPSMYIFFNGSFLKVYLIVFETALLLVTGCFKIFFAAAFNTAVRLKKMLIRHIGKLASGYHDSNPSGSLMKIIEKNTDSTETLIAHRLRSVVNCDRIIVLDHGRVAGNGKHDELMQNCPVYKKLYNLQAE